MEPTSGPLAFFGGPGWGGDASIERALLESHGGVVTVIPAGAAYERPDRVVTAARERIESLGGTVVVAPVLNRRDAEEFVVAETVRFARIVLLVGGSPLHLRSVLKDSAVLTSLVAAWHAGAAVAGMNGAAMVLSDPMVDPRGGAFTVGLGLVRDLAVVPGYDGTMTPGLRRTVSLAPESCAVVALGEGASLLRAPDGTWTTSGEGPLAVYLEGAPSGLEALAGKRTR